MSLCTPAAEPFGFAKYHALGNDYIVLAADVEMSAAALRRLCHRHFGLGADGVLCGPRPLADNTFGLRIFNADGSEAELSGNGLRIMARAVFDQGLVEAEAAFVLRSLAGDTSARVASGGRSVRLGLAAPNFWAGQIPVAGGEREVIGESFDLGDEVVTATAVTVGNPHCVVVCDVISAAEVKRLGPRLETHPAFPRRTNVQLLQVRDRQNLAIEIWERGSGYTLASGSCALAAASVAFRLGLAASEVTVAMPGGNVEVAVRSTGLELEGDVVAVANGHLVPELWA